GTTDRGTRRAGRHRTTPPRRRLARTAPHRRLAIVPIRRPTSSIEIVRRGEKARAGRVISATPGAAARRGAAAAIVRAAARGLAARAPVAAGAGNIGRHLAQRTGNFFLPTYGTLLAAVSFDQTGTTRIGNYLLNHSFMHWSRWSRPSRSRCC